VPSLVRLQLSGNVNQRRYKKERKKRYEETGRTIYIFYLG
jgi:hypothetical protein